MICTVNETPLHSTINGVAVRLWTGRDAEGRTVRLWVALVDKVDGPLTPEMEEAQTSCERWSIPVIENPEDVLYVR
jgi:hypothetical protein